MEDALTPNAGSCLAASDEASVALLRMLRARDWTKVWLVLFCVGAKVYENVLTEYCSTASSRKADVFRPAEFVTEYRRM